MSAQVLRFKQKPVVGLAPKPLMWQCKCGSQRFSFTEHGYVYCAGGCGTPIHNLRVEKQ